MSIEIDICKNHLIFRTISKRYNSRPKKWEAFASPFSELDLIFNFFDLFIQGGFDFIHHG